MMCQSNGTFACLLARPCRRWRQLKSPRPPAFMRDSLFSTVRLFEADEIHLVQRPERTNWTPTEKIPSASTNLSIGLGKGIRMSRSPKARRTKRTTAKISDTTLTGRVRLGQTIWHAVGWNRTEKWVRRRIKKEKSLHTPCHRLKIWNISVEADLYYEAMLWIVLNLRTSLRWRRRCNERCRRSQWSPLRCKGSHWKQWWESGTTERSKRYCPFHLDRQPL